MGRGVLGAASTAVHGAGEVDVGDVVTSAKRVGEVREREGGREKEDVRGANSHGAVV